MNDNVYRVLQDGDKRKQLLWTDLLLDPEMTLLIPTTMFGLGVIFKVFMTAGILSF